MPTIKNQSVLYAEQTSRKAQTRSSNIWKAVGYVRLSREDEMGAESGSIQSQKHLIEDWAAQHSYVELLGFFADDGYSGSTFDRPGFEQMMELAKSGEINTIIVKDLSRFGRSYLDCGVLIERELPRLGVRLFSIADSFDSMEDYDQNMAILLPVKNLMNEMHVMVTSEKVRTSLAAKRERGECVANWAPYGYKKNPANKHQLIVDEEASAVVRCIFSWRLEGKSASEIARILNKREVASPAAYRQAHGQAYASSFIGDAPRWHAKTVLRILRNEVYTGTLVQGKTQRSSWRSRVTRHLSPELWHRSHGMHEPLVDSQVFWKVSELI
ncbi:MAG: recombinase family protein [Atopobiaceae bacterium]|nr:recombinase family protein [Atopobiaceae bacterium]